MIRSLRTIFVKNMGIFVIPGACLIRKYGHFFLYFSASRCTVSTSSVYSRLRIRYTYLENSVGSLKSDSKKGKGILDDVGGCFRVLSRVFVA